MLAGQDPKAAAGILPENGRRIVRALEVIELTGKPFTASLPIMEYVDAHTVQIGVDVDRATLDRRIGRGSTRCSPPGSSTRSGAC